MRKSKAKELQNLLKKYPENLSILSKVLEETLDSLVANKKITELTTLSTMANTFLMTGVDTTDTSMAPSGTNKKVLPSVTLPYFNLSPVGAKIATTADFTAAQLENITVMNFIGNNSTINLGNLTISDTLTIYVSPGAGFSHENITVDTGASFNIIGYDSLDIASSGFPVGNGFIKRYGIISGGGFLYARKIYSVPLSAFAFSDILSHTEDCVIIDAGLEGTGLNLSVPGSVSIRDRLSTLMPAGVANVLTVGAGCTAINPELNLNTGGSVQIASVLESGSIISPRCTSLVAASSCTILNTGIISSVTNDASTTPTVTTSAEGVLLDSSSPCLVPTAAPLTGGKQISTCAYADEAVSALTKVANAQTGNYVLTLDDFNTLVTLNSASAITLTLPQQSSVTTETIFTCAIQNIGTSIVTIVKEGAETLIGNITLPIGSQCIIRRPTTTSWSVFGGQATVNMAGLPFVIQTVTNSTVTLVAYCGCPMTFLGLGEKAASLTTAGLRSIAINGTPITGLSAVPVTTTGTYTVATALNNAVRGDIVSVTYSGTLDVVNDSMLLDYTQKF